MEVLLVDVELTGMIGPLVPKVLEGLVSCISVLMISYKHVNDVLKSAPHDLFLIILPLEQINVSPIHTSRII